MIYSIGDTGPAGGKIFYVGTDNVTLDRDNEDFFKFRYLEVIAASPETYAQAPTNEFNRFISNTYDAGLSMYDDPVGRGFRNSKKLSDTAGLVRAYSEACTEGGFTDWYVPSLRELSLISKLTNSEDIKINENVWTSSQQFRCYKGNGFALNPKTGAAALVDKTMELKVILIRGIEGDGLISNILGA